jgi:hypothetical protein
VLQRGQERLSADRRYRRRTCRRHIVSVPAAWCARNDRFWMLMVSDAVTLILNDATPESRRPPHRPPDPTPLPERLATLRLVSG